MFALFATKRTPVFTGITQGHECTHRSYTGDTTGSRLDVGITTATHGDAQPANRLGVRMSGQEDAESPSGLGAASVEFCACCTRCAISCWMDDALLPEPEPLVSCPATGPPCNDALICSSRLDPAMLTVDCWTSSIRPWTEFLARSAEPSAVAYRFSILSRISSRDGVLVGA